MRHLPTEAVSRDQPDWSPELELAAQQLELSSEVLRAVVALIRMWADKTSNVRIPEPVVVPRPASVVAARDRQRAATRAEELRRRAVADEQWPPVLNVPSGRAMVGRLVGAMSNGD